jgi:thioredoxin-dependent peroxiredoxin
MPYPTLNILAPDFTASVTGPGFASGSTVQLSALRGRPVVLYFYPKDDTPGCTTQACGIRDGWAQLQGKAQVFGVSIDPIKKHDRFIAKYELPFPLISDEDKSVVEAYGVWVQKTLYGREYMGTERTTFVIDAEGRLAAVLPKVKPNEHLAAVLAAL